MRGARYETMDSGGLRAAAWVPGLLYYQLWRLCRCRPSTTELDQGEGGRRRRSARDAGGWGVEG